MKMILNLLVLAAVTAVSNSSVIKQNPGRFIMVSGSIRPGDELLTKMTSNYTPLPGLVLNYADVYFAKPTVELYISYVTIVEKTNSFATARITSGGVGSDHLNVRLTPHDNQGYDFEINVWGTYVASSKMVTEPEIVTYQIQNTSPVSEQQL